MADMHCYFIEGELIPLGKGQGKKAVVTKELTEASCCLPPLGREIIARR